MTLDNVDAVRNDIINTTDGVPGVDTIVTGRRIKAASTLSRGYGRVNAARAVTGAGTTTGDIGAYLSGGAGLASFGLLLASDRPLDSILGIKKRG